MASVVDTEREYAERNRGPGRTPVARTLRLGRGLWAWTSYREEWDRAPQAGTAKRFSFRSAGLTFYFGYRNNRHKPQMFRAEWTMGGATYKRGDHANPHWHFDAMESLRRDETQRRATEILATLRSEEEAEPRDFSPPVTRKNVRDVVSMQELSKVHFASAASWWKSNSAPSCPQPHIGRRHTKLDEGDVEAPGWGARAACNILLTHAGLPSIAERDQRLCYGIHLVLAVVATSIRKIAIHRDSYAVARDVIEAKDHW